MDATAVARGAESAESATFGNVAWAEGRGAGAGAALHAMRIPIDCYLNLVCVPLRTQNNRFSIHIHGSHGSDAEGWQSGNSRERGGGGGPGLSCCGSNIEGTSGCIEPE